MFRAALDRALELAQVVVVVGGQARHPLAELHASARQVDAAASPLPGVEPAEQVHHLAPAPSKRLERREPVAARVLALLRPAVRIERMADLAADPPGGERLRARAEREDRRILHREDGQEADQEELLDIPNMTHDFFQGPAPRVGTARQRPVVLAVQQTGHLVGRAPQPREPIAHGPGEVFLHGRHDGRRARAYGLNSWSRISVMKRSSETG
jgi:hypothetical protein